MRVTIKAQTLAGFHRPELLAVFFRVYALNYFINQSDGQIVQPGGPFYYEWPCSLLGTDLTIPEIQLESTIDALNPAHPEGLRYFAGFYDAGGNPICPFWPKPVFSLDANPSPTYWAAIAAYNSPGVAFDWTTEHADHYSKEEFDYLLENPPPVQRFIVRPPLNFDGETLSIPQASAVQNGYLSHNDFILFSGGEAVAVTSFNTRTGEIVLLNDDVMAALGYTPSGSPRPFILKDGDTMTGALQLAGPPVNSLDAATKAYVLSTSGASAAALPGEYLLSAFGASGSPLQFTGAVTSGSTTLTLTGTPAPDFAVGQGILVKNGASSGDLWTVVDAIAGNVITLHIAAGATRSSTTVQHDDQAAIQAAIDYVFAAKGGTLLADVPGLCRLNGPFNDIGSLLKFPFVDMSTEGTIPITIRGTVPQPGPGFFGPASTSGITFQTDRVNTSGAILRAATPGGATPSGVNNISLTLQDLAFRTYDNPQISAVDLEMAANVFLKQITVDAGIGMLAASQPTAASTFALRCPRDTVSSTGHQVENTYVQNYYTGLIFTEQMVCIKAFAMRCMIGLRWDFSYHPAYAHVVLFHCPTSVYYVSHSLTDAFYDIERAIPGTGWEDGAEGKDFYDPQDRACGFSRYCIIESNSGARKIAANTGCSKMSFTNVGLAQSTIPVLHIPQQLDAGDVDIAQSLQLRGGFSLSDGAVVRPVDFGANDTAATGHRPLRVANTNASTIPTGIISYWKHDEATGRSEDIAGPNPMLAFGGITTETGIPSGGNCRRSDGTGSLFVSDNPSLDFSANKSISINGWLNLVGLPSAAGTILGKWDIGGAADFLLSYSTTSHQWEFDITADGSTAYTVGVPATPTLNTWYMVTGIFDFTNHLISIQLNAGTPATFSVPVGTKIFHSGSPLTSFSLLQGNLNTNGRVDEVGLWGRVLTGTEVTALYASNAGLPYPF